MKNPYKIGTFAAVLGATLAGSASGFEPVGNDSQSSVPRKYDPSRCYWLEGKITAEGLCGEKLRPDVPRIAAEAKKGNGLAAYRLGQLYSSGQWGVERDLQKGVEWYRVAARNGFRQAQIKLGFMYEFGRDGVERDLKQALYWFEAATEHGVYPDMEDKILSLREKLENTE
ncbi:MAG: tetratricopeptide repeat protein [Granulosicoccaceae bacterium]